MWSAYLLLVSLLGSIALSAGSGFSFTGNFSASEVSNNDWDFRQTTFSEVDIDGIYIGGNLFCAEITANKDGKHVNGSVGIVAAATYVFLSNYPVTYVTSYAANVNLDWSGQGTSTFDVSGAAAYIVSALISLVEKDSNGDVVATQSLKWALAINPSGLSYNLLETSKANDDVQYIKFVGTSNDPNEKDFNITITHLASKHAGIVNGDIGLVPGSLESIYEINNYPYASSNNTISLVVAVATGGGKVTASGQTIVSSDNTVYVSFGKQATIDGKKKQITISGFTDGTIDDFDNSNIQTQINARYGASASVHKTSITFTPGAAFIYYDPAIGAGASVTENAAVDGSSSSASSIVLSISLLSLILFALLLA